MKGKQIYLFFTRLFLVLIVFTLVDFVLGKGLGYLYFSERKGQHAQTTYTIDSAKEDIVVIGSSRAVRHYDPDLLAKGSGLSAYNAGRDAQRIPFYTAVEEVILNRSKPKLLILDVLPYELSVDDSKYSHLTILLPYCKSHPELIKYVHEVSPFEPYKLWSQTYPYNSSLFITLYNHLLGNKGEETRHGYEPLTRTLTAHEAADLEKRRNDYEAKMGDTGTEAYLDKKALQYYRDFLDNAKKHDIRTLVVISPSLFTERNSYIKKLLESVAGEYPNVTFADYTNNAQYTGKREKFADQFHLNESGAEEFSAQVNAFIREKGLLK
ncbi:MAG: hypothetical protein INR69_01640 [Mucilaginibacter polytrichastri]|nr:hypothetical protein [Mucilaginibacter polytrichastri]